MNQMLRIRKLADKSTGERIVRFDPETGEKKLVNPATEGEEHEPWPLAGIQVEGPVLQQTAVSTGKVAEGIAEGWIERIGETVVHEPGGPPSNPWAKTHTFQQATHIVIKTVNGDLRYRVVGQPGKHADDGEASGYRIDWFYTLELEG